MDQEVVDYLKEARSRVESGWIQGHFAYTKLVRDHFWSKKYTQTAYCVVGALGGIEGVPYAVRIRAEEYFGKAANISPYHIMDWNDDPSRTKEEVLTAFDKAVEIASKTTVPPPPVFMYETPKYEEPKIKIDIEKEVRDYVNSLPEMAVTE